LGISGTGVDCNHIEDLVSRINRAAKLANSTASTTKESFRYALSSLGPRQSELRVARDIDVSAPLVEVIELFANRVEAESGGAFFVAAHSAIREKPVGPALIILGDVSVQGNIKTSPPPARPTS
jgi:ATP-dependent Lon protease